MPSSLDEVDRVDVVCVDNACAAEAAHELSKNVGGDLAPGEVAECRKRDRDRRVDVPARDAARDPNTESGTDRPAEVKREVILSAEIELGRTQFMK